ncbi:hypothetical protein IG631_14352 [Alternaria alternata]|nr:hypothetical protein IG631_14352 [Alternaria alternata]
MAGQKRAASPPGGASAAKKTKKKKLLNMVYHDVFYGTDDVDMTRKKSYLWYNNWGVDVARRRERPRNRPDLSLLYVSRQLNHETALLPYKLTRFHFAAYTTLGQHPHAIMKFLEQRSTAQIEVLCDMRLYCLLRNDEGRIEKSEDGACCMTALALALPPT